MLRPSSPRNAARRLEALAELSSAPVLEAGLDLDGVAPEAVAGVLARREHAIAGRAIQLALGRAPTDAATVCLYVPAAVPPRLAHLDLAPPPAWTLRVHEDAETTHPWTMYATSTLSECARIYIDGGHEVYFPRLRRYMVRRAVLLAMHNTAA